jgi:uncharacterized peroxidase-related enzyme
MSRLDMIDPATTTGKTKELLEGVAKKLGFLPTLMRVLANSPSALRGYLGFSGALAGGALPVQLRERIAIAVAEVNGCRCCLAAHTEYGRRAGLTARDLEDARAGASSDPAAAEALRFARAVMDTCGNVPDQDLAAVRAAGFNDGEIVEIAAIVAINVFSNSVNNLAQSSPDFPDVAATRT